MFLKTYSSRKAKQLKATGLCANEPANFFWLKTIARFPLEPQSKLKIYKCVLFILANLPYFEGYILYILKYACCLVYGI